MVGKAKHRTAADRARFAQLQAMGCVACHLEGNGWEGPDVHHVLLGGERAGHQHTIPLCPWHHRGANVTPLSDEEVRALRGPSLKHEKRAFIERYGTEGQLVQIVNGWLERAR